MSSKDNEENTIETLIMEFFTDDNVIKSTVDL